MREAPPVEKGGGDQRRRRQGGKGLRDAHSGKAGTEDLPDAVEDRSER